MASGILLLWWSKQKSFSTDMGRAAMAAIRAKPPIVTHHLNAPACAFVEMVRDQTPSQQRQGGRVERILRDGCKQSVLFPSPEQARQQYPYAYPKPSQDNRMQRACYDESNVATRTRMGTTLLLGIGTVDGEERGDWGSHFPYEPYFTSLKYRCFRDVLGLKRGVRTPFDLPSTFVNVRHQEGLHQLGVIPNGRERMAASQFSGRMQFMNRGLATK